MLRHMSLVANDTARVARFLAGLLDATALRAPSPPFPAHAWFVCSDDAAGSYLEVLPWGSVHDPSAKFGISQDFAMRPLTGAHVLLTSPRPAEGIFAAAEGEGWRAELADARLFQVIKVWIENTTLVEFLPPEHVEAYLDTFGRGRVAMLDAKFRALESGAVPSPRSFR